MESIINAIFEESFNDCVPKPQSEYAAQYYESGLQPSQHLETVKNTFRRGITWALGHSKVQSSSKHDQALLRREMKAFYIGQVTCICESSSLSPSSRHQQSSRLLQETYYDWVHTTASAHVAGPLTFTFLTCMLGTSKHGQDCFQTAEAKYVAQDLSMHLACLARMENDVGSVIRDRKEHNLNSVSFAEFDNTGISEEKDDLKDRLQQLKHLAAYERECAKVALANLGELGVSDKVMKGLKAFAMRWICLGRFMRWRFLRRVWRSVPRFVIGLHWVL